MNRAPSARLLAFAAVVASGGASFAEEAPPNASTSLENKRRMEPRTAAPTRAEEPAPDPTPRGRLTIDPELSRAADKLLELAHPVQGAIVAIDLKTRRILTWAERRHGGAPGSVLTTARVPAASVFKLITSAALLETGAANLNDRVCVSGGIRRIERQHLEEPHGEGIQCGSFSQALGHSRNAVFAQLATARLARKDLLDVAERLGFNQSVPFDWPVPVGQLDVPYNDLEFARTAAGFRGSTLSPLGAAYLASIVADGGLSRPLRLFEAEATEPALPLELAPALRVLSATTAWRLTRMMEVTTHSGTCRQVFSDDQGKPYLPNIRVAGKTGTLRPESREETTSWFIGFAPSREPRIALSVMLENGVVWRRKAAEVARDYLRVYFKRQGARSVSDPFGDPARP